MRYALAVRALTSFFLGLGCISIVGSELWPKQDERWDSRFALNDDKAGPLVVHGQSLFSGGKTVSRWDGANWVSLGQTDGGVAQMLSLSNLLYVAGSFTAIDGVPAQSIAVWNGQKWAGLSSAQRAPKGKITSITQYTNGTVLVVEETEQDFQGKTTILLWNGKRWQPFGETIRRGTSCTVQQIAGNTRGDLYARLYFEDKTEDGWGGSIMRWENGRWRDLPRQPRKDGAHVIAVSESGQLVAGGEFYERPELKGVAVWNSEDWNGLGEGLDGYALSLVFHKDALLVGGCFGSAGGVKSRGLAKWDGKKWTGFGGGMSGGGFVAWDGPTGGGTSDMTSVGCIAAREEEVYITGRFTAAGEAGASGLAHWDGRKWRSMADSNHQGVSGRIKSLSVIGSNVFAAGTFTAAGNVAAPGLACWNSKSWSNVPGLTWSLGFSASASDGNRLFVATQGANSQLFCWNGANWEPLKSPIVDWVAALACRRKEIYAGGYSVARLLNGAWTLPGDGLWGHSTSIRALAVHPNGDVYVGGSFHQTRDGRVLLLKIARWDGERWNRLGDGVGQVDDLARVNAIAIQGTNVYVGGNFQSAGKGPANAIACWDGARWKALAEGVTGGINAIVCDGANVYVGGKFTQAGNIPATNVAMWDGKQWSSLGSGVNGRVGAMAVQGRSLYLGGEFTIAGGKPSVNFARWELQ